MLLAQAVLTVILLKYLHAADVTKVHQVHLSFMYFCDCYVYRVIHQFDYLPPSNLGFWDVEDKAVLLQKKTLLSISPR
jgi:hypothetical protein